MIGLGSNDVILIGRGKKGKEYENIPQTALIGKILTLIFKACSKYNEINRKEDNETNC